LSGARDDDDPPRVARCSPAIALQTNATTWAPVFTTVLVLSLGSFSRFVTLLGDGLVSGLSWQFSNKPV
jgi:hypothetical protein